MWQLLKEAATSWLDDHASSMGAALAYYSLFSIAPLLLIVTSVAGLVFGADAARGQIIGQISGLIGQQSAEAVELLLARLDKPMTGVIGTVMGVGVMLVGATSVFAELRNALDRIWRSAALPDTGGLWSAVRVRLLSFGLILAIGFLLIVSLVVSAAMAALGEWWAPWLGEVAFLASALNSLLSFGLLLVLFAAIYKWMPRVTLAWRDVGTGALTTALLFEVGRSLIGLYIGRSGVASAFGAAASPVVLMLWVYYSAQIFLFGAEITWVYARRYGSLRHAGLDEAPAGDTSSPAPGSSSPATD
jgi:membrane protein